MSSRPLSRPEDDSLAVMRSQGVLADGRRAGGDTQDEVDRSRADQEDK